jgi:hypothetical protein
MYIIYRVGTDTPIAATHTKMGAKSACRHYHKVCRMENPNSDAYARFERIDSYNLYRFGYIVLRAIRRKENKRLERFKENEYECKLIRRAQQAKVASLY